MNRCYLLEVCWFLAHGQVRQAFVGGAQPGRLSLAGAKCLTTTVWLHYGAPHGPVPESNALPLLLPPLSGGVGSAIGWWQVCSLQARLATLVSAALGDHRLGTERLAASARRQFLISPQRPVGVDIKIRSAIIINRVTRD